MEYQNKRLFLLPWRRRIVISRIAIKATLIVALCLALILLGSENESSASIKNPLLSPKGLCLGENIHNVQHRKRAIGAMVCHIRFARSRAGARSLQTNRRLHRSASSKTLDIIKCNAFSHTACGRPFDRWIKKYYLDKPVCWKAAENIDWGSTSLGTPREIFRAWLQSDSHRKAILDHRYKEMGIGFRVGEVQGYKKARVWVLHLGTICS